MPKIHGGGPAAADGNRPLDRWVAYARAKLGIAAERLDSLVGELSPTAKTAFKLIGAMAGGTALYHGVDSLLTVQQLMPVGLTADVATRFVAQVGGTGFVVGAVAGAGATLAAGAVGVKALGAAISAAADKLHQWEEAGRKPRSRGPV